MLASIITNFFIGLSIAKAQQRSPKTNAAFVILSLGILINAFILIFFKYANFICTNLNQLATHISLPQINLAEIHLPLGISFFTFQALSYIIDVYRKETAPQKNAFNLALYIALFPQLIAGPIVRYHDIAFQILQRVHSLDLFASGVQRFILGLAKKILLANTLGEVADQIFLIAPNDLSVPLAWIGITSYALQIYFDFSGYSDMAIGLGCMFGFQFQENFNYPYAATSMRDFWRRWHISLSTWFRDYVYIPLGGSRASGPRVYRNLFIVFILTGFWHGASWNFAAWGLLHGFLLIAERVGFGALLKRLPRPLQHSYVLVCVLITWVFFRSEDFTSAISYLKPLCGLGTWEFTSFEFERYVSAEAIYAGLVAAALSTPIYPWILIRLEKQWAQDALKSLLLFKLPQIALISILLLLCLTKMAALTYNPFIYFRF